MFRKRSAINKSKSRIILGKEPGDSGITETKDSSNDRETEKKNNEKLPLKTDINSLKSNLLNFSTESSSENFVFEVNTEEENISMHRRTLDKTQKQNQSKIVNSYEFSGSGLDEQKCIDSQGNKRKRSIYERRNFDTLESRNPNIKQTLRIDYQHDICKDYKETGYCGFGDTCKFLHDRSDFVSGWKLDREWKLRGEKKLESSDHLSKVSGDGISDKKLPSFCFICKRKWVDEEHCNPVVTSCNHYFCEKCAFNQYMKSSKCFQCGTPTNGTFNVADNILKAMKSGNINFDEKFQTESESETELNSQDE